MNKKFPVLISWVPLMVFLVSGCASAPSKSVSNLPALPVVMESDEDAGLVAPGNITTNVLEAYFPAQAGHSGFFQAIPALATTEGHWETFYEFPYPVEGATMMATNITTNLAGFYRAGVN